MEITSLFGLVVMAVLGEEIARQGLDKKKANEVTVEVAVQQTDLA